MNVTTLSDWGLLTLKPSLSKDRSETKSTTQSVGHFSIGSGHFFAHYINIFQKSEVLTVILKCLTCLNLNWIKN